MKKISCTATFFRKRVIPIFGGGVIVFFLLAITLQTLLAEDQSLFPNLAFIAIFAIGFYILLKYFQYDLVEDVYECENSIKVVDGDFSLEIPFTDINKIWATVAFGGAKAIISTKTKTPLGSYIIFVPDGWTMSFYGNPAIRELNKRIEKAKGNPFAQ